MQRSNGVRIAVIQLFSPNHAHLVVLLEIPLKVSMEAKWLILFDLSEARHLTLLWLLRGHWTSTGWFLPHVRCIFLHSHNLQREIGCWPWDVSAGIVIAEEAGGLVTGSHDVFAATSSSNTFGDVTEDILTGRKYIVVRAIAPNPVRFSLVTQTWN